MVIGVKFFPFLFILQNIIIIVNFFFLHFAFLIKFDIFTTTHFRNCKAFQFSSVQISCRNSVINNRYVTSCTRVYVCMYVFMHYIKNDSANRNIILNEYNSFKNLKDLVNMQFNFDFNF